LLSTARIQNKLNSVAREKMPQNMVGLMLFDIKRSTTADQRQMIDNHFEGFFNRLA
jgi:hypothetical protein